MNLTLKQMFKFGAVCMGVCALSASAVDYVSDSFESPDGAIDKAIGEYKQVIVGQDVTTNWFAESGDASKLVEVNPAYADIVDRGPITNATKALMLKLETEGNTLSRAVTAEPDFTSAPVYIDTLIQFTPSEDEPVISGGDVKIALYVNAESNLVVVSKKFIDLEDYVMEATTSVIDLGYPIDPEKWYRLTMKVAPFGLVGMTDIWVDGALVTHASAYDRATGAFGGSSFVNIADGVTKVSNVSFQGTGALDELVVTDEMPTNMSPPASVMLTLVSLDGKVTFSPVGPVASGTEVTMTSADWFRIVAVDGPITEDINSSLPAVTKDVVSTLTASAAADCSVTVTVAQVSGDMDIGGTDYDLGKLSDWAIANRPNSLGEGDVVETDIDDYLLNVDRGTDAELVITSIEVDAVNNKTTITVEASSTGDTGDAVDFTDLNGVVKVYATDDLAVAFTLVGSFTVSSDTDTATVVITGVDAGQFLKATVEQ